MKGYRKKRLIHLLRKDPERKHYVLTSVVKEYRKETICTYICYESIQKVNIMYLHLL